MSRAHELFCAYMDTRMHPNGWEPQDVWDMDTAPRLRFDEYAGQWQVTVGDEIVRSCEVYAPKLLANWTGDVREKVIARRLGQFEHTDEHRLFMTGYREMVDSWLETQPLSPREMAFKEWIDARDAGLAELQDEEERVEFVGKMGSFSVEARFTPSLKGIVRSSLTRKLFYV